MIQALRWLRGAITGILSFAYLIFVLNPVQMLSIVVYPFSKRAFREVGRWCARSIWGLWVIMAERQNRIAVRFTGDALPPRENSLLLANHQSMADVLALMCLAWRCRRVGDMKWFVKDILKYFPGFGWGMYFLDCIFVKRDWARDKANIERLFSKYQTEDIPMFLVSFLEGTRLTAEKHARAREFARERGLTVPRHTLVPRTKGFLATMTGLRTHLDAVYSVTIGYPEPVPSLVNCFEARVKGIDIHVRRYPIESMPVEEEELTQWVFDRFKEKDDLLEAFKKEERFPGTERPAPVRIRDWFVSEKAGEAGSQALG